MSLTKLTVNLVPKADAALELAVGITGDSKTDTVNRALQVYAFLMECAQKGEDIFVGNDKKLRKVKFL